MEPEAQTRQLVPAPFLGPCQPAFVRVEEDEIVDVANIAWRPQHFLDEMIETVEVDVGEELACLIAQRQPAPPFQWTEQVVIRKPMLHLLLRVGVIDDQVDKPQLLASV